MSYIIDVTFKARLELAKASSWYDEKQPGLGERFEAEVFKKIEQVQNNPLHYQVKKRYREALTDVFPYLIVYKIVESRSTIVIVSVFHTSRHPRKKHG